MKFNMYFCIVLCVSTFMLGGCKKHKTLVDIGNEQQIFYVSNAAEPADVDPHIVSGIPEYHIVMSIFEGLAGKDPKTLEPVQGVADRWAISEDGRVYTFHIRDNARWSDGDKLTAHDFEYSWHRLLMPAIASETVTDLFAIKNAEKFYKGEITDFNEVGIKAIDDATFQVTLNNPTAYFLSQLDNYNLYPVQKKTIEKFGKFDERATQWTRAENFVGNGPFTIKEWIPSVVFSVKRNPYYWDAKNVKLNEIHFFPYDNLLLEERMFKAGQLHKTEWMPSSKIEQYKNNPAYHNYPYYGLYYYLFNNKIKPLNDVRVRKALACAIDREAITNNVLKGGQIPLYHYTPDNPYGYKVRANIVCDKAQAQKFLAEAGFPEGKGFPELQLTYNTHADHLKVALAIQQMWKTNLGINITLRNLEWKVYLDARKTMQFDIMRRANIADVLDPSTFLFPMMTNDAQNDTGWGSKRFDELMELSKKAKSNEERFEYFQEADKILIDEMPVMPIYSYATNNLVSPSVKGYYNNVLDYHPYKYIYLDPTEEK